jgi:Spy/CpxP family protein refolding chaperone
MKTKTIITALAITLTFGVAAQAGAWMGGMGHYDCDGPMMGGMMNGGGMMGYHGNTTLTTEQQQQVNSIESEYTNELQTKEKAIQDQITAINNAYNDDSTTVADLRAQRQELYNLKQDYWQTRRTINNKVADTLGQNYYGTGGWGPRYCAFDNADMGNGTPGNAGMMMGARHCRW